jgi:FkbM family methyltransferase
MTLLDISRSLPRPSFRALLPRPVYRSLRRIWTAWRIKTYRPQVVEHTYSGVPLRVLLADSMAERWYDLDWPSLPEIEALRENGLATGARVFDLGAHHGVVALILARLVGERGSVVAVEPGRHNVSVAQQNRALNHARNLTILHAAASDGRTAAVPFVEDLNGHVEEHEHPRKLTSQVPAVSVDGLARSFAPPDVVFVDVEGFEQRVVAGARDTLASAAATFLIEVHVGCGLEGSGGSVEELLSFFPTADYAIAAAPATDGRSYAFSPHHQRPEVLRERFFLLAFPHRRAPSSTGAC